MYEPVPYPTDRAVPGLGKRSRKPLIVLGPRGRLVPRSRWSIEEVAVFTAKESATYPAWHLGPRIELDASDEQQLGASFTALYITLASDTWLSFAGICVPAGPSSPCSSKSGSGWRPRTDCAQT